MVKRFKGKARKLLSMFLVLSMMMTMCQVFMIPDVHAGYRRYCEVCDQWVDSENICDLDDTVQHCIECCEDGAAHCCICGEFDPDKACPEDPMPHCLDCCDGKHCVSSGCSHTENSIGDHVCSDCGYCEDCAEELYGMHECEICGDCLFVGGDICFYHDNGYHHEDCCHNRHCKSCNGCEEIEGVDICDDCGFCLDCAPEDEHFCEFCGECMHSTVGTCSLDDHHCSECCEDGELHCQECGVYHEDTDCPDCRFCMDCAGDNGSDEHYSEISGECLNREGACEHGYPITQAECEEILCEECGQHFEYEVEACETCLDEGVKRCVDCCQADGDYDNENDLCPNSPEYQEYLCPICETHANDTKAKELCPDCGLCEECCLAQVSDDTGTARLCTGEDFHCTHFCTLDNQCKEFCDATSKCNGAVCDHTNVGAYDHNATIHWQLCADCHAKVSVGKHDFEWVDIDTANGTAKQRCTLCGYTTETQPYHVHTFGPWEISGQHHTRRCTVAGCTKVEKEEHTFDGNTCTVCGFTKTDEIVIVREPEKVFLPGDITPQELLNVFAFRAEADYYLPLQYTWNLSLPGTKYGTVTGEGTRFTLTDSHTTTDVGPVTEDQRLDLAQAILDELKKDGVADCGEAIVIALKIQCGSMEKTIHSQLRFEHTGIYAERLYPDRHSICCRDCAQEIRTESHNFDQFGRCVDCGYTQDIQITSQPRDIKKKADGSKYFTFSVKAKGNDLKYQWCEAKDGAVNKLEDATFQTVTIEIDPSEACKEGVIREYYCIVSNDDHQVVSQRASIELDHNYTLKGLDQYYHANTCKYCGYVDPDSVAKKSRHEYEGAYTYDENRYDIIVNNKTRFKLTEDILKDMSDSPETQQAFIDTYCGSTNTGKYWQAVIHDEVDQHSTQVCEECGYIHESDGTYSGTPLEDIRDAAKNCDYYKTHKYHGLRVYNNNIIHWNGCRDCSYVAPGSVELHDMRIESTNVVEEDGKYYRLDIYQCKDCYYDEVIKTEITQEEATPKRLVKGSFLTGWDYAVPAVTQDYAPNEAVRTYTIQDVPNDKRLFSYSLYFVEDGKEDEYAVSNYFNRADRQGTYHIENVKITCEKIPGDEKSDYTFTMNFTNPAYIPRDFKVNANFVDVTTLYAEEGILYTTEDNTAEGTQTWSGTELELIGGDTVFFKADEVSGSKVFTGISKMGSDGQKSKYLYSKPVVPGEFGLHELFAYQYLRGAVTVKPTYIIDDGNAYTVGFDHDNNPATPTINLEGTFAEGTEVAIPSSMKYYGAAPAGQYFSHWNCAQKPGEYLADEIFNVVGANMVFTPVYETIPPKIIPIAYNDNLSTAVVPVPATTEIYAGQPFNLDSAVPAWEGYQFIGWSTTARVTTMDGDTLSLYQPGAEVQIAESNDLVLWNAKWLKANTITASAGNKGTISPKGDVFVMDGESQEFTFTPKKDYVVDVVTVDGTAVEVTGNSYTIANVTADMAIHVTFKSTKAPTYQAEVILRGGNGSPSGEGIYEAGETVTIFAGTRSGYNFDGWTVVSGSVTLTNPNKKTTTFIMPAGDVRIKAKWQERLSSGGSSSGGSSSGGSSSSGSSGSSTGGANKKPESKFQFEDVQPSDWFHDAVYDVVEKGLFTGTSATQFSPYENATRAMVWTVLARMANANLAGGESWYEKAQTWAVAEGISDGTDPDEFITREQFVTMLYRNAGSPVVDGMLNFADHDAVSDYAYEALVWAVDQNIINGKGGNILDPQGKLTRAEMATILSRMTEK